MDFTGLAGIHANKNLEGLPEGRATSSQKYDVDVKANVSWRGLIERAGHCPLGCSGPGPGRTVGKALADCSVFRGRRGTGNTQATESVS